MPVCLNHPDRIAYTKCKTCGKPLCEECKQTNAQGDFCSLQCAEKAVRFQEKFPGGVPPKKTGMLSIIMRSLKGLVGVVLALAVLGAIIVAAWGRSASAPEFIQAAYEWAAGILGL